MRVLRALCALALTNLAGAQDWPGFRGLWHQGVSQETNVPITWSESQNIAWKVAVPGAGWSSPVISGGKLFLTTADEGGLSRRVLCYDAKTGKLLWNTEVFRIPPPKKEEANSYATPTPIAQAGQVVALFGDGSVVALDFNGKVRWVNRDHRYYGVHGMGVSPVLSGNLIFIPYDITSEGPDVKVGHTIPWDKSFVIALDWKTGKLRWKSDRGMSRVGHVTPAVITTGGREQLISGAGDWVIGYDAKTGRRLWWLSNKGEGVVPSIVPGDGLAFATSGFGDPTITAFRIGGEGDVTAANVAWTSKKAVPMVASFLYLNGILYAVNEGGIAQALDAKTGTPHWTERLGGKHFASPIAAGGNVYFQSQDCETTVIEAGPAFKVVSKNKLEGACQASLAVSGRRIYLRTKEHLYAIAKP